MTKDVGIIDRQPCDALDESLTFVIESVSRAFLGVADRLLHLNNTRRREESLRHRDAAPDHRSLHYMSIVMQS
jgi:hypothetical protein